MADQHSRAEIARYIAQFTCELTKIAASTQLEMLVYFLSMARVEAEMIARDEFL